MARIQVPMNAAERCLPESRWQRRWPQSRMSGGGFRRALLPQGGLRRPKRPSILRTTQTKTDRDTCSDLKEGVLGNQGCVLAQVTVPPGERPHPDGRARPSSALWLDRRGASVRCPAHQSPAGLRAPPGLGTSTRRRRRHLCRQFNETFGPWLSLTCRERVEIGGYH